MGIKVDTGEVVAVAVSLIIHASVLSLVAGSGPAPVSRLAAPSSSELIVSLVSDVQKTSSPVAPTQEVTNKKKPIPENQAVEQSTGAKLSSSYSLASNEHFFTLPELEKAPQIVQDIDPNPAGLEAHQEGGRVVIRLWINEKGDVIDQALVESILPAPFVDSAMESFRNAKFVAGVKDGLPVKSVVTVVVNYAPVSS